MNNEAFVLMKLKREDRWEQWVARVQGNGLGLLMHRDSMIEEKKWKEEAQIF